MEVGGLTEGSQDASLKVVENRVVEQNVDVEENLQEKGENLQEKEENLQEKRENLQEN